MVKPAMLKPPTPTQYELEMVTLEELVPQDHLLRLIDRHIQFDFIREQTAHLYSADNGRPALDPVRLFKMLFIGYLFGIRSERQLVREIQVNVAYRWFLGMRLTDKVIDASTFSQNHRRRFIDTDIDQTIFDTIVEQAIQNGLIGGRVFYTDNTHLKANANKNKHQIHVVEQTPVDYLAELNAAIDEDRAAHGKPPLPKQESPETTTTKAAKISPTDPDAGYFTPAICRGLEQRDIYGVIGYRRPNHWDGYLTKRTFTYQREQDVYVCPNGQTLHYRTTNRLGYREYASSPSACAGCPMKAQCTRSANGIKVVTRQCGSVTRKRWMPTVWKRRANVYTPDARKR